jgi:undecaprenyl-diphosphatase
VFAGDLWGLLSAEGRAFDVAAYHAIHDTYRAPWLDRAMGAATKIGETKTGLYGLLAVAFFGTPTAQVTAKLCAVSLIGSGLISQATKYLVGRERPEGGSDDGRHNTSFPSQHASGAAAVAVLVARRHGRLGVVFWIAALWIGLSRIYLGRHYPTDVLTGYLLGAVASWLVLRGERWFEKLHF